MSEPSRLDADLERALLLSRRLRTVGRRAAARRARHPKPSSGMREGFGSSAGSHARGRAFGLLVVDVAKVPTWPRERALCVKQAVRRVRAGE